MMTRRRFAFWIGLVLFWLGRRVSADSLDETATSLMEWSEKREATSSRRDRWRPNANRNWRWYERQTRIDDQWKPSGVTQPTNSETGKPYTEQTGYLDESLVPEEVRRRTEVMHKKLLPGRKEPSEFVDGRPPSKWIRSLNANELRLWLRTIRVPAVGVDGMTFWAHLTRDHSFSADRIRGLTVTEQAKLHSAAHYGY